jgi:predicted nucleic acid-binding protein
MTSKIWSPLLLNSLTPIIVLDSSAVINILACGQPARFLSSLGCSVVVPRQVINEICREPVQHTDNRDSFPELLQSGLLLPHDLANGHYLEFLNLVGAAAPDGLGDGEAATIASAEQLRCIAIIDERKATRIARNRRPVDLTACTLDLYAYSLTTEKYAKEDVASLVFSSMQYARMRIPSERRSWVVNLIGGERAKQCNCFPRSLGE